MKAYVVGTHLSPALIGVCAVIRSNTVITKVSDSQHVCWFPVPFKGDWIHFADFSTICFNKGDNFCDFLFAYLHASPF